MYTNEIFLNIIFLFLDVDHVTGENFFDSLDNGVIVCRLARVIQEKARTAIDSGRAKGVINHKIQILINV